MINDEFLFKIETIIDFLKSHGGYYYKLYNRCCPDEYMTPDSNIVEYAEDIKEYWTSNKKPITYEDFVINEICTLIRDNLRLLLTYNDNSLVKIRKYCSSMQECNIPSATPYLIIIELLNEALIELQNADYIYDFRDE